MEEPTTSAGRRFHLKQIIGEGAFGEVYLAEQDSGAGFRRKVAIKLLNSNVARSREAGRRMRDEARILGLLSHRNIVTVLDLVRLGDRWAVIMDFVPGADLEQVLDALNASEGAFPVAAALEVGAAVCAALCAAYEAEDGSGTPLRVVHRDIKPSNVRLTLDGDVKVLDFGVARVDLEVRESSTRGSAWLGTERYMSPERILCESDDTPGDVYATAATVVELLLGRPLGRTPVLEDRHAPFVDDALARVAERCSDPAVGTSLTALLRRALAASPGARPSARELADGLRTLSRRADGETLVEFCRRFVPLVGEVLGHQPRPADGILSEVAATGRSGESGARAVSSGDHEAAPTLMPDEAGGASVDAPMGSPPDAGRHPEPPRAELPAPPGVRAPVVLAFAGVALAAIAGLGWLVVTGGAAPADPPEPVTPIPGPAAPAPEAVAPAPAPEAVDPAPAPEPIAPAPEAVAPRPEPVAPVPVARPAPSPAQPRPAPGPEPAPAPDAPRVESALIALQDASGLQVTCGDVSASGTASVRLRGFPAGACTVQATWLGATYSTTVTIDARREVRCAVDGGQLVCR